MIAAKLAQRWGILGAQEFQRIGTLIFNRQCASKRTVEKQQYFLFLEILMTN